MLEAGAESFCNRKMQKDDGLGLKLPLMFGKGRVESHFSVGALGPLYSEMSKAFQSSTSFQKDGYNLQ